MGASASKIVALGIGIGLSCFSGAGAEVVAVRALPKGTVLSADMVETSKHGEATPLLGQQLRRPIYKGKPINLSDTEEPDLVERQSQVLVQFRRGGLLLTISGRALRSGGLGEQIPVLLDSRRQPLSARVVGHGTVEVGR
ncbi:flagellar basal body P-ring formation chaperone FlgA [Parvularcula sp. LCG005]|uniref:flagellar basal body P-ring formation chaperone FlgA n=1 Tax=Parvularcula sp. LCG005 TaxID=3078805 RepID=UPI002943E3D3|nr:flagellar basal body P-ring formation chaperone FlgA [Parvularcula sp. LCG005]WOI52956.1 flagellar basal body P-ring formation chaperone FlgA [Parvularcula sp. LCG005]